MRHSSFQDRGDRANREIVSVISVDSCSSLIFEAGTFCRNGPSGAFRLLGLFSALHARGTVPFSRRLRFGDWVHRPCAGKIGTVPWKRLRSKRPALAVFVAQGGVGVGVVGDAAGHGVVLQHVAGELRGHVA